MCAEEDFFAAGQKKSLADMGQGQASGRVLGKITDVFAVPPLSVCMFRVGVRKWNDFPVLHLGPTLLPRAQALVAPPISL